MVIKFVWEPLKSHLQWQLGKGAARTYLVLEQYLAAQRSWVPGESDGVVGGAGDMDVDVLFEGGTGRAAARAASRAINFLRQERLRREGLQG